MKKIVFPAFLIGSLVGTTALAIGYLVAKDNNEKKLETISNLNEEETKVEEEILSSLDSTDDVLIQMQSNMLVGNKIEQSNQENMFFDQQSFTDILMQDNKQDEKFDAATFIIDEDVKEMFDDEINLYYNGEVVEKYQYIDEPSLSDLEKICETLVEKIS